MTTFTELVRFVCPVPNPGWRSVPTVFCRASGRCDVCGSLVCAEHGCQQNRAHQQEA